MVKIDYIILFALTSYTLFIYLLLKGFLFSSLQRIFFFFGIWGTWFICGLGASYEGVLFEYYLYYVIYLVCLGISFVGIVKFCIPMQFKIKNNAHHKIWNKVLEIKNIRNLTIFYFVCLFLPLVYPELRIGNIFNPPKPDISFFTGLAENRDFFEKIVRYLQFLLFPFYLIFIYFLRKKIIYLCFFVLFPLYIQLCESGYVGRGDFFVSFLIISIMIWFEYPKKRKKFLFVSTITLPFLIYLFFALGHIRAGNEYIIEKSSFLDGIKEVLFVQTNFPYYSKYIIFSENRASLDDYFVWLVTTPIPKVITGDIEGSRINYEIAYAIRGLKPGDLGFTVDLTGAVTESIFIYGNSFFWVHALFIGALFGFLCSIIESLPRAFVTVGIYFAVYWGYIFNRAGIASAWPKLVNGFIPIYVLVFYFIFFTKYNTVRRKLDENTYVFSRENSASSSPD